MITFWESIQRVIRYFANNANKQKQPFGVRHVQYACLAKYKNVFVIDKILKQMQEAACDVLELSVQKVLIVSLHQL